MKKITFIVAFISIVHIICAVGSDIMTQDYLRYRLDDGSITIFAVNRSLDTPADLSCDLRAFGPLQSAVHTVLHHDDMKAVNTEEAPYTVAPSDIPCSAPEDGRLNTVLPAASWNVIRLLP